MKKAQNIPDLEEGKKFFEALISDSKSESLFKNCSCRKSVIVKEDTLFDDEDLIFEEEEEKDTDTDRQFKNLLLFLLINILVGCSAFAIASLFPFINPIVISSCATLLSLCVSVPFFALYSKIAKNDNRSLKDIFLNPNKLLEESHAKKEKLKEDIKSNPLYMIHENFLKFLKERNFLESEIQSNIQGDIIINKKRLIQDKDLLKAVNKKINYLKDNFKEIQNRDPSIILSYMELTKEFAQSEDCRKGNSR